MGTEPHIADRYQSLAFQPVVGHSGLRSQRPRQMPVALAAERGQDGMAFSRSQGQEISHFRTHPAPLFPVTHADTPTKPVVKLRDGPVVVRDAEVVHPAPDVAGKFIESIAHRNTPTAAGEFSHRMLEVLEGLGGPAQLLALERKPQELAVVGLGHPALLLVDHQLEGGWSETA